MIRYLYLVILDPTKMSHPRHRCVPHSNYEMKLYQFEVIVRIKIYRVYRNRLNYSALNQIKVIDEDLKVFV